MMRSFLVTPVFFRLRREGGTAQGKPVLDVEGPVVFEVDVEIAKPADQATLGDHADDDVTNVHPEVPALQGSAERGERACRSPESTSSSALQGGAGRTERIISPGVHRLWQIVCASRRAGRIERPQAPVRGTYR